MEWSWDYTSMLNNYTHRIDYDGSDIHLECEENVWEWYQSKISVSKWISSNFAIKFVGSMSNAVNGNFYNKYWGLGGIKIDVSAGYTVLDGINAIGDSSIWYDDYSDTNWTLIEYSYLNGSIGDYSETRLGGLYDNVSKWHGFLSWGPYWLNRTFVIDDSAIVTTGFKMNYDISIQFDVITVCQVDSDDIFTVCEKCIVNVWF